MAPPQLRIGRPTATRPQHLIAPLQRQIDRQLATQPRRPVAPPQLPMERQPSIEPRQLVVISTTSDGTTAANTTTRTSRTAALAHDSPVWPASGQMRNRT